jgi:hypothetical protein
MLLITPAVETAGNPAPAFAAKVAKVVAMVALVIVAG